jgi:hypothetical protein
MSWCFMGEKNASSGGVLADVVDEKSTHPTALPPPLLAEARRLESS